MSEESAFRYYIHDNASFRGKEGKGFNGVDDVLHGKDWKPYEGDRIEPVMFGRRVSLADAMVE